MCINIEFSAHTLTSVLNLTSHSGVSYTFQRTYDMAQDWTHGGKDEIDVNLVDTFLMFAQHDEKGTQYSLNDLKNLF